MENIGPDRTYFLLDLIILLVSKMLSLLVSLELQVFSPASEFFSCATCKLLVDVTLKSVQALDLTHFLSPHQ